MEKNHIDLYLEKVRSNISEEEKIEETKKIYKLINKSFVNTDKNRRVYSYVLDDKKKEIINYFVESGALNKCHEIGLSKIIDLPRVLGGVLKKSEASNKQELEEKLKKDIEIFLEKNKYIKENPSKDEFDIYDGIATRYFYNCKMDNKDIGELGKEIVSELFSHLPKNVSYKDTVLYNLQLLPGSKNRDDIFEVTPKDSIKEYEQILFNPELDTNGKIINFFDYDNKMFEYLNFYGARGIDTDKKIKLFQSILDNTSPGNLCSSKTYSSYFLLSELEDDKKVTYSFNMKIIKDILARIYEKEGMNNLKLNDSEYDILKDRFLPSTKYMEDKKILRSNPNEEKFELRGEIEDRIGQLYNTSSGDAIEIAKYVINLQKNFKEKNKPKDKRLGIIYDYIKNINLVDVLKENLKEICEEKDSNIDKKGLRRIDYADIALSLILEADFDKGVQELCKEETSQLFKDNKRDIYDSRAIRKLAKLYVENSCYQNYNLETNKLIYKYVSTVTSKPNFNLFKEQGISDLLQLYSTRLMAIGEDVKILCQYATISNPRFSMDFENTKKYINNFIDEVGDNVLNESKEVEFDKFLDALTKMRIFSEESLMPQNATDFLLKQSIMTESIINTKGKKYSGVTERAIENLGKLENKALTNNKPLEYIYIIRDYLDREDTLGNHDSSEKIIRAKREKVNELKYGNLDVLRTIFHENTHFARVSRLGNIPKSFKEYMMIKETILEDHNPEYYKENYFLEYQEIEAREKANKRVAKYIDKLIPPSQTLNFVDNMINDTREKMRDSLKTKFNMLAKIEEQLYEKGINKKDKDGEKRTINQIFDRRIPTSEIVSSISNYPALLLEYENDGTKRTLSEQMVFVNKYKRKLNPQMMREIIKKSEIANSEISIGAVLQASKELIYNIQDERDIQLIDGIIEDNLPIVIENYKQALRKNNIVDIENSYSEIKKFIEFTRQNPIANNIKSLEEHDGNEKSMLERLEEIKDEFESVYNIEDQRSKSNRRNWFWKKTKIFFKIL